MYCAAELPGLEPPSQGRSCAASDTGMGRCGAAAAAEPGGGGTGCGLRLAGRCGLAVAYAREHGEEVALAAFNAPSGELNHGEVYIFAYDFNGKNLAHGCDQSLVGKDLIDLTDPTGKPLIREFVRIAKEGSGWLHYVWANPANDDRVEPKLGYITKLGGDGRLTDEEAGAAVGGGSGAADCHAGAVAYSSLCETGTYAQP